jgi:hypothetical protein
MVGCLMNINKESVCFGGIGVKCQKNFKKYYSKYKDIFYKIIFILFCLQKFFIFFFSKKENLL